MIVAWTFLIVLIILIVLLSFDTAVYYTRGKKTEGAEGVLFILLIVLVASLPAQYIFGS